MIKIGDKVTLKKRTIFGWKGCGTVVNVDPIIIKKDDYLKECDPWPMGVVSNAYVECSRCEISKKRKGKVNK